MKVRYPDFIIPGDGGQSNYGTNVCLRDTREYIIPAIIQDLIDGGNYNTVVQARAYLTGSGALQHINGEVLQSIYTWGEVAKLCVDVITLDETTLTGTYSTRVRVPNYFATPASQPVQDFITNLIANLLDLLGPTGQRFRDGADLVYFNRKAIADEAVYYIEDKYEVTVGFSTDQKLQIPDRNKCVRDLRDHILPAISGDLLTGGNNQTNAQIDYYIDNQDNINHVEDELLPMLDAIEYARMLAEKAISNLLIARNENPADVAADFSDYYQMQWSDEAIHRDDQIVKDPKAYTGTDKALDAADLLVTNARAIAGEAVDLTTKLSAFQHYNFRVKGGKVNCEDDIVDLIESIAHDLRFGGNSSMWDASALYLNTTAGLKHVTDQSQETLYAFKVARDMSQLAVKNKFGFLPYEDEGQTGQGQQTFRPDYYDNASGNKFYDAGNEILNNLRFIATTAVGRGVSQYPSLAFAGYGYQSCVDDVVDMLEAMAFNLKHGGNNKTLYATELYVTDANAVQHVSGQSAEVKYIFEQARDIAIEVVRQLLITKNGYTEGDADYDQTITIDQQTASVQYTPSGATYDPATGDLIINVPQHNLTTNDTIRIATNSLIFTCSQDQHQTTHAYPRASDPASTAILPVTQVVDTDNFKVNVGPTETVPFSVSNSTYDPATGLLTLDVGSHKLKAGTTLNISDHSLLYRCSQDNYRTIHSYPRATDPASQQALDIVSIGATSHTATHADYNPVNGRLTVTVPNHGFNNGDKVKLVDNSLVFSCGMDSNYTLHSYPRSTDDASGTWLTATSVTHNSFTIDVGSTPISNYAVSNASYNPTTGTMILTIGSHSLNSGAKIRLLPNSITFTCEEDDNQTNHSYPRTTTTQHTATGGDYDAATGLMTVWVPGHTFVKGDHVKFADNSMTFSCAMDGHATDHAYPRSSDPASGAWLPITWVGTDQFKVNVGTSPIVPFTPSAADYEPTTGELKLTIGPHHLTEGDNVKIEEGGLTFTCNQDSHQTLHPYPRNQINSHDIQTASYTATTGVLSVTTTAAHSLLAGDYVKFADGAITMTCTMDGGTANKTYPRSTDPVSGKYLEISNVGATTFHVNVGTSPIVNYQPTGINYNPTTGIMEMTIGAHNHIVGDSIKFAANGLTFTCAEDDHQTNHTYPRSTDPFYDTACPITAVTATTISVQVLNSIPSTNTTAHTFVSATANAVQTGGDYVHSFVSAVAGSLTSKQDRAFDQSVDVVYEGTPLTAASGTTYDPNTGIMSVTTSAAHGMVDGDYVKFRTDSVTFTCTQGGGNHSYPRLSDPINGEWVQVSNVTNTTFEVQVLDNIPSTNVTAHTFVSGTANGIIRKDDTITLNVGIASNTTPHIFVSATSGAIKAGGNYDHTFVTAANNGITWKKDIAYDYPLEIIGTTLSTISVAVLAEGRIPSTNETQHTFVSATPGAVVTGGNYDHLFVSAADHGVHLQNGSVTVNVGTTPENHYNVQDSTYDAATGDLTLTVGTHHLKEGTTLKIANDSLIYTCDMDDHNSEHSYPRATDPSAGEALVIKDVSESQHSITDATYNPSNGHLVCTLNGHDFKTKSHMTPEGARFTTTSGVMEIFIKNHGLQNGQSIKIQDAGITFRCAQDQYSTDHQYPRASDPASGNWLVVTNASQDKFEVNVGTSSNTTSHRFYGATTNGITVAGDYVRFEDNAITFRCAKDSYGSDHTYPRPTDPASGEWLEVAAADTNTFTVDVGTSSYTGAHTYQAFVANGLKRQTGTVTVNVGSTPTVNYTPSTGVFTPLTGVMQLTIGNHWLNEGDNIRVAPDSLVFRCGMDNYQTDHAYPRAALLTHTPTGASYDGETGILSLNITNHGMGTGDWVKLNQECITFTCDMDGHATNHPYPRADDPIADRWIQIQNVSTNGFDIFVGKTPTKIFDPSAATFNPSNGYLEMTIGAHSWEVGDSVWIADHSLAFTCSMDDHYSVHSYPRPSDPVHNTRVPIIAKTDSTITVNVGSTPTVSFDVVDAAYDPTTGDMTLTTNSTNHGLVGGARFTASAGTTYEPSTGVMTVHCGTDGTQGMVAGDRVRFDDYAVTFTCDKDSHQTNHEYPRPTDRVHGEWLQVYNVTADTFQVQVLPAIPSTNTTAHTFVSGTTNGIMKEVDSIKLLPNALTFRCDEDGQNSDHSYPRNLEDTHTAVVGTSFTPTDGSYDATTGNLVLDIGSNSLAIGDRIRINEESIKFTCEMDGNNSIKSYPRSTDPTYGHEYEIIAKAGNTVTVFVGTSPIVSYNVSNAVYDPQGGNLVLTIGAHTLTANRDSIRLADNSLTFTCDYQQNNNQTQKTYPRASGADTTDGEDYAYRTALPIIAATDTTITINVNGGQGPITDLTVHNFISATAGAVITGGNYTHTWSSADAGAVITGGTYHNPQTGVLQIKTSTAHAMGNGDWVKFDNNALTFTCAQDNHQTNHTYPRPSDPFAGKWIQVFDVTSDTFKVVVNKIVPQSNTTPHIFISGVTDGIKQKRDSMYDTSIPIVSATNNTITINVLKEAPSSNITTHVFQSALSGAIVSGGAGYTHTFQPGYEKMTPTNAVYNPTTGFMTLTVGNHWVKNGDHIRIDNDALTFTCAQDGHQTDHTYPRAHDPVSGNWIKVQNVTPGGFDINVLDVIPSTNQTVHTFKSGVAHSISRGAIKGGGIYNHTYVGAATNCVKQKRDPSFEKGQEITNVGTTSHTLTNAIYRPETGVMTLTIPSHGFSATTTKTATTGTSYNPNTGILTIKTTNNHGFVNGDKIKIADNGLTFTCTQAGGNHSYPRTTDPASNKWLTVMNQNGTDEFDVNVGYFFGQGPISNTTTHTFVSATTDGIEKANDKIKMADGSITFSCGKDDYATDHAYPRATDPSHNEWLPLSNVSTHQFDVFVGRANLDKTPHTFVSATSGGITRPDGTIQINVGTSSNVSPHTWQSASADAIIAGGSYTHKFIRAEKFPVRSGGAYSHEFEANVTKTPRDAAYNPTTGVMTLTINGHGMVAGDYIKIADNSLVFSCGFGGGGQVNKSYPRSTDPASNSFMPITVVDQDNISVQVLASAPSTNTDAHTFISAEAHCVTKASVITGGNYSHTFISSNNNSITTYSNAGGTRCTNEASGITTLMGIPINLFGTGASNPNAYMAGIVKTIPGEWPCTGERAVRRDISITYDSTTFCQTEQSAVNTLWDIVINTVDQAAQGNASHLGTVTRTAPTTTNTNYIGGTCYNVTSASHTLFNIILDTLGGGTEMYAQAARLLMYNNVYIRDESMSETLGTYPGYGGVNTFSDDILKAFIYDFITAGNAKTLGLVSSWFDSEGTFIAFPALFRTRVIFHFEAIKRYMINVLEQDAVDPGPYENTPAYTNKELRATKTAVDKLRSLCHLIDVALNRSTYPTTYVSHTFDPGNSVSNGGIDIVGHKFEAYDQVKYVALGAMIAELDRENYYIHPHTTADRVFLCEYIDGEVVYINPGITGETHSLAITRVDGVHRVPTTYGSRDVPTPINGGINLADVCYGTTTGATGEIVRIADNHADIYYVVTYIECNNFSSSPKLENGEAVVVQGATGNTASILATDNATYIKVVNPVGTFNAADVLEGVTSGGTATVVSTHSRILVNFRQGEFFANDKIYSADSGSKANALIVRNNNGALLDNQRGRVTFDIDTITGEFAPNDVIYGSVTDQIIEIEAFATLPNFGEYVHARDITRLTYSAFITDTGITDSIEVGDVCQIFSGGAVLTPNWTVTVTEKDEGNQYLYVCNSTNAPEGVTISDIASNSQYTLGKLPEGSNFPSIWTLIAAAQVTSTTAYGRIEKITQLGTKATLHLGDTEGSFQKNAQIIGDNGFQGACSAARTLRGRVRRYFRGFDGTQMNFKLTENNGTAYFPDPSGHMMIFVNGILQPPGADYSFTAFSDNIQFTEAPAAGSSFHGVYVGKLRQLDDIGFDFDSLRNSFNLKLGGVFYSLTLTEGVQSNTIRPENNIICQLNGVIQEPGIGFEIVGSRIIFSEVPRAGSTFVAFSYIGSDVDVIAATVVPPIEAGDDLIIEGEEENRTVALIESSNSLITFEYSGAVKGRNADALATIEKGRVTKAVLTGSGDGYSTRPNVDVISSSGFGAKIKALVGLARIDVKNAGQGYVQPIVNVETTVEDSFLGPTGAALNGGIDIYDPGWQDPEGGSTPDEQFITISTPPVSVTVNQGQSAAFTIIATSSNGSTLSYQWQKKEYGTDSWLNVDGATTDSISIASTQQGDGGDEYRVGVTSPGAVPVLSTAAVLTVNVGASTVDNFTPDQIFDDN